MANGPAEAGWGGAHKVEEGERLADHLALSFCLHAVHGPDLDELAEGKVAVVVSVVLVDDALHPVLWWVEAERAQQIGELCRVDETAVVHVELVEPALERRELGV